MIDNEVPARAPGVIMRLARSHRKGKALKALPGIEWLYSFKSSWYYRVPPDQVEAARRIGCTKARR